MPPKGAEHSVMELATHPSVYLSLFLPPSIHCVRSFYYIQDYYMKIRHVGEREAEGGHN